MLKSFYLFFVLSVTLLYLKIFPTAFTRCRSLVFSASWFKRFAVQLQFDVWVSAGAPAASHSWLLILISWEVEPVGGRYRDQLGGGERELTQDTTSKLLPHAEQI